MEALIHKEQMDYFWKKKEFVSFVLSILVFMIHISSFAQYAGTHDTIGIINDKLSFFFKESMTRFAVPMFFMLSGIAFFRDYDNNKYRTKLVSRFFALCVPYLMWNTLWMLFDIFCSYSAISNYFVGRKIYLLSVSNIMRGIFLYESNLPFWYILYLIIFTLLAPAFYLLVRNRRVGIIATVLLSALSVFELGGKFGFVYEAYVYYLLGAMLGKHYFVYVVRKTSRSNQLCSAVFLTVYVVAKNIYPINTYFGSPFVKIVIFMLASASVWSLADVLMEKIPRFPILSRSFAVYAMHTNVSAIICKLLYLLLPRKGYFAFPNFLLTMILTLVVINVFCVVFERCLPRTYALLMGKGIKSKKMKGNKNV